MAEPISRRYAHSEGITHLCYDSKKHLVTCGHDCDVRTFAGVEEDDCEEFSVASEKISALACYRGGGKNVIAIATDDNTIQAYTSEGAPEGLLMRFTAPVTYLAVNPGHTHLAATSCDFSVRVLELGGASRAVTLHGHEAPVLCARFDPRGEYLASSSCDGTVRIWSLKTNECVKSLAVLEQCSDTSLAKSLCYLSWQPGEGKVLAVPVGREVWLVERGGWGRGGCLAEEHREPVNVVSWSPCGRYLASAGVDGCVTLWDHTSKTAYRRFKNENGIGITSLEWNPSGMESEKGNQLAFADREGYVGVFEGVYPSNQSGRGSAGGGQEADPLAEDSLLMEGIPADDIFKDDYNIEDDIMGNDVTTGYHGDQEEEEDGDVVQSRKRRRMDLMGGERDEEYGSRSGDIDDGQSSLLEEEQSFPRQRDPANQPPPPPKKAPPAFSEKQLECPQKPFQPSATPSHLHHHFMLYNLVGVVRSHDDDEATMIEVEFHNAGTHHAFSIANHYSYTMAALSEQALVLACGRTEDIPSQLQCVHFGSWDNTKDWTVSLPSKESITAVAIGDGWIATATNKQQLRLFSTGGVQREVLSVPGAMVTLGGWGGRLAVVYHTGPCTENVFSLTVWVLDVRRRRQLHPPHTLPLSHHARLEWLGFSEGGLLISYDSKGIVRILSPAYGGLSWLPVLDTTKQVGNKSDHYFIVGMTHNPHQLRGILCRGLEYPPVQPKPVMSTISLKMPLCEMSTEKAELEDQYLQAELLRTPGQQSNTATAQHLMKLFALACKSNREFRACEIAGLMPDERSMNLALTYASRTQHARLARHISELIQHKAMEFESENEEDYFETESTGRTNQIAEEESEYQYAKARSTSLNQGPQLTTRKKFSFATTTSKTAAKPSSSKPLNKFDRYMEEIRQGKFLSSSLRKTAASDSRESAFGEERANGGDETRELFSDAEDEGALNGEESAEEEEGMEAEGESEGDDPRSDTPPPEPSLLASLDSSEKKRPNPFRMATPVSKRVQVERKSSFLDNIMARVDEEQKRKERKIAEKKAGEQHGSRGSRKSGSSKAAAPKKIPKASSVQSNLKTSFFKTKDVSSKERDSGGSGGDQTTGENEGALQADNGSHDNGERSNRIGGTEPVQDEPVQDEPVQDGPAQDGDDSRGAMMEDSSVNSEEVQKLTSKEKLANFAFTAH